MSNLCCQTASSTFPPHIFLNLRLFCCFCPPKPIPSLSSLHPCTVNCCTLEYTPSNVASTTHTCKLSLSLSLFSQGKLVPLSLGCIFSIVSFVSYPATKDFCANGEQKRGMMVREKHKHTLTLTQRGNKNVSHKFLQSLLYQVDLLFNYLTDATFPGTFIVLVLEEQRNTRLGITEANHTNFPPESYVDFSNQCRCPFLLSVDKRVKLEMDTTNHVGIPLMLALSPLSPSPAPSPSLLNIHGTDINTDLYSFTRCGLHHRPGREQG